MRVGRARRRRIVRGSLIGVGLLAGIVLVITGWIVIAVFVFAGVSYAIFGRDHTTPGALDDNTKTVAMMTEWSIVNRHRRR